MFVFTCGGEVYDLLVKKNIENNKIYQHLSVLRHFILIYLHDSSSLIMKKMCAITNKIVLHLNQKNVEW